MFNVERTKYNQTYRLISRFANDVEDPYDFGVSFHLAAIFVTHRIVRINDSLFPPL